MNDQESIESGAASFAPGRIHEQGQIAGGRSFAGGPVANAAAAAPPAVPPSEDAVAEMADVLREAYQDTLDIDGPSFSVMSKRVLAHACAPTMPAQEASEQ